MGFSNTGNHASAALLEHSLTLNPGQVTITETNAYSYIAQEIMNSSEYQAYVDQYIAQADSAGKVRLNKIIYNDLIAKTASLEFNSGDLSTAIHGTTSTQINGHKTQSGSWDIQVTIVDTYDFDKPDKKASPFVKTGVNAARVAQTTGTISTYPITINFTDTRPGTKPQNTLAPKPAPKNPKRQ